MKNLEKDFNQYLANLAVMNHKLHNIHWNVEGTAFVQVHEYTEGLYDRMFEYFDEVAEHLKKYQLTPMSTMKAYLEVATVKEIEPKKFGIQEALEIVLADLVSLREEATQLRHSSDEEGWFSAVGMFEGHIDAYNKDIWFLRAMLEKNEK